MRWLVQFEDKDLTRNQKRLLAYAYEHGGALTSHAYQKLVGVDIYTAGQDIKDLIQKPKGRVYEVIGVEKLVPTEKPSELIALEPILKAKGFVKNKDIRQVLGVSLPQANRIAHHLVNLGWLVSIGDKRGRRYVLRQ